jgi:hypothetical protein
MSLRKEAKGRGCMVRLPGICNFNSETVVLAHIRLAGVSGMTHDELRLAHFEGMARTIAQLEKEGLV